MRPSEILFVALPPVVRAVARQAAQLAFPENRINELADLDAVLQDKPSHGCQLLVLAGADAASVARTSQALDGNGLPRWAVVALGPDASDLVETVPPPDWNPPLLARVFRAALLQHELLRENLRLRGDLKTVARRISHDLRTPIGCVHTTAHVLPELDAASLPGMAGIIRQSSEEISQIISRVSFVLKASAEPASFGPVNMGQVVGVALQQLEAEIKEGGAEVISPATWPDVTGVGSWLQVIWWNLLSNALRHGGPRSRIQITWTRAHGECRFSVADRGTGVPAAREAQLFAPFDQLHERNVSGLGLAIVHRLVALQAGRCTHEKPPEGGACFSFTLPLVSASG